MVVHDSFRFCYRLSAFSLWLATQEYAIIRRHCQRIQGDAIALSISNGRHYCRGRRRDGYCADKCTKSRRKIWCWYVSSQSFALPRSVRLTIINHTAVNLPTAKK